MTTVAGADVRARRPLLQLALIDAVFAHWPVDPLVVTSRLPPGVQPDTWDGVTYVGVVGVRMHHVRVSPLPAVPYVATFDQVNVRVYGVCADGRRGVVFCCMDTGRFAARLFGRLSGLPYVWSHVRQRREGSVLGYTVERRGEPSTSGSLVVRTGPPRTIADGLAEFLTARWGLFARVAGSTSYLPLAHRPWPLHEASAVDVDSNLVRAAGFDIDDEPVSLLWSPGVDAVFRAPSRVR